LFFLDDDRSVLTNDQDRERRAHGRLQVELGWPTLGGVGVENKHSPIRKWQCQTGHADGLQTTAGDSNPDSFVDEYQPAHLAVCEVDSQVRNRFLD